jgi:LL-diaminopimelate aminotransferase
MKTAKRIEKLPPYLFVGISKKIAEKRAQGIDVISLGIGDPDLPTPLHIIDRLCHAAREPQNHRYPESEGLPEFRRAVATWYKKRFDVKLDPDKEVVSLIGAKDGVAHISLCLIDPGDIALVPDPGYPVYARGTMFCGGESYYMPLREENGFLPDLNGIPAKIAKKAKVLWINYPNNPTGAVAELDFFERVVSFAKKYDIAVCHDARTRRWPSTDTSPSASSRPRAPWTLA